MRRAWKVPRLPVEFMKTVKPFCTVSPLLGETTDETGPGTIDWPGPNTPRIRWCEFWVGPEVWQRPSQLHSPGAPVPHWMSLLRKKRCPPHGERYVIGSTHANS